MSSKTVSRREFLKTAGMATAGVMLAGAMPGAAKASAASLDASSQKRAAGANRKVNLACIGIGNRGREIITEFEKTGLCNVVALCDVDLDSAESQKMATHFPKAKKFKDFRQMFDKMAGSIDAVSIAVPDHAHFPISMLAMSLGKHVYVEKPMARTFHEAELMIRAALKYPKLTTQVGNQGHSEANYFQFKAWVDAGIIKDVTAVTAHMNGARRWHPYDPNITKYPEAQPIPPGMDWDTWTMAAKYHEFNDKYHPGNWRGWFDFGVGALGDWGAHILDTIHEFLDLGLPYEVNPIHLVGHNDYFFPQETTLLFRFPKRGDMPAMDVTWYDGVKNIPQVPEGYGVSELDPNIPSVGGGKIQPASLNPGKIIYSKELTFKGGSHGSTLSIIPEEKAREMESRLPEVPQSTSNHFANFLLSCMGEERTRSPFEINGPLSQVFALGVIATQLGTKILFDRRTKEITNNAFANALLAGTPPRKGWEEFYKL